MAPQKTKQNKTKQKSLTHKRKSQRARAAEQNRENAFFPLFSLFETTTEIYFWSTKMEILHPHCNHRELLTGLFFLKSSTAKNSFKINHTRETDKKKRRNIVFKRSLMTHQSSEIFFGVFFSHSSPADIEM